MTLRLPLTLYSGETLPFKISLLLFPLPVETSGELPCNGRKRKRVAPAEAPGGSKRLKAAPEGDDPPACGRSPGVSVLPDRLQRAVTAGELTELLHYAALGRAGGVKQPR